MCHQCLSPEYVCEQPPKVEKREVEGGGGVQKHSWGNVSLVSGHPTPPPKKKWVGGIDSIPPPPEYASEYPKRRSWGTNSLILGENVPLNLNHPPQYASEQPQRLKRRWVGLRFLHGEGLGLHFLFRCCGSELI